MCSHALVGHSDASQGVSRHHSFLCALQIHFSAASGGSDDYENETFVWGTTINAQKISREFVHFFELFMEDDGDEPKYIKLMREVSLVPTLEWLETHGSNMMVFDWSYVGFADCSY